MTFIYFLEDSTTKATARWSLIQSLAKGTLDHLRSKGLWQAIFV